MSEQAEFKHAMVYGFSSCFWCLGAASGMDSDIALIKHCFLDSVFATIL